MEQTRSKIIKSSLKSTLAADLDLLEEFGLSGHKNFKKWSHTQRLDWIGSRILAKARTTKSHREMSEQGYLSHSQYERRLDHEVFTSAQGTIEELCEMRGQYSRAYVHKDPVNKNVD